MKQLIVLSRLIALITAVGLWATPAFSADADNDGVDDAMDLCPATAANVNFLGCSYGSPIVIDGVSFDFGSVEVNPASQKALEAFVTKLTQFDPFKFEIATHTDSVGKAEDNHKVSAGRANAIQAALLEMGLDPDWIQVTGYGETQPVASNDTPEGRAQNRRVEMREAR